MPQASGLRPHSPTHSSPAQAAARLGLRRARVEADLDQLWARIERYKTDRASWYPVVGRRGLRQQARWARKHLGEHVEGALLFRKREVQARSDRRRAADRR